MQNVLHRLARRPYAIVAVLLTTACVGGAWALAAQEKMKSSDKTEARVRVTRVPVRSEPGPLRLHLGEFKFECTRCHRPGRSAADEAKELGVGRTAPRGEGDDFPSMPLFWSGTFPHASLKLDHGRNDQCFDCHNKNKRDTYLANDGSEIPHNESHRLCSKCHGPRYRDWLRGIHGRRSGYWNLTEGESTDLACIQCHNPHHPPFMQLKPMPGPRLRGEHAKEGEA